MNDMEDERTLRPCGGGVVRRGSLAVTWYGPKGFDPYAPYESGDFDELTTGTGLRERRLAAAHYQEKRKKELRETIARVLGQRDGTRVTDYTLPSGQEHFELKVEDPEHLADAIATLRQDYQHLFTKQLQQREEANRVFQEAVMEEVPKLLSRYPTKSPGKISKSRLTLEAV